MAHAQIDAVEDEQVTEALLNALEPDHLARGAGGMTVRTGELGGCQLSRTACVCIVRATMRPDASKTSVSTTIVVLPSCSGRERATT